MVLVARIMLGRLAPALAKAHNGKRDGLSAVGMLVRLVGPTGAATVALARENAGPPYSARVRVPKGGIRLIRFGVASSTPGSVPFYFPLK
jgi:hypothetical protein